MGRPASKIAGFSHAQLAGVKSGGYARLVLGKNPISHWEDRNMPTRQDRNPRDKY